MSLVGGGANEPMKQEMKRGLWVATGPHKMCSTSPFVAGQEQTLKSVSLEHTQTCTISADLCVSQTPNILSLGGGATAPLPPLAALLYIILVAGQQLRSSYHTQLKAIFKSQIENQIISMRAYILVKIRLLLSYYHSI